MHTFIAAYRNLWYKLTFPAFTVLAFYMLFWGVHALSDIQIILMASLMALLIHQFEEYVLPGGAPVIVNIGTFGERENYLRYPGNMHSSMLVNNVAYIFYALAVVFPEWVWLGLATMFFNLFQLYGHGWQMNKALNTWYNPGLASVVFLFVPIAVYYFYFVSVNGLAAWITWLGGAAGFVGLMLFTIILPVQCLKNPDSPYAMPDEQVEKFKKLRPCVKSRRADGDEVYFGALGQTQRGDRRGGIGVHAGNLDALALSASIGAAQSGGDFLPLFRGIRVSRRLSHFFQHLVRAQRQHARYCRPLSAEQYVGIVGKLGHGAGDVSHAGVFPRCDLAGPGADAVRWGGATDRARYREQ
ncbi:HXXEE domain-containing protein [Neisseria weixii]|uniref:HXXEE domain-containing protein n=1 Tax=Neisseria weixii TaxID=1853276 RepID=UPI0035A09352